MEGQDVQGDAQEETGEGGGEEGEGDKEEEEEEGGGGGRKGLIKRFHKLRAVD